MVVQNPHPILWNDKRYHTLNYYLRKKFGQKVFKIPLDAGFTCPNRDGTLSTDGCAFCSARGSGDFAGNREFDVKTQFKKTKEMMHKKWRNGKYIAYFQAFSNTYASISHLQNLYESALEEEGVVGLAIATRPDCLPDEVLNLLNKFNKRTHMWVELGLQTIHNKTAQKMNLHYNYNTFLKALDKLNSRNIEICAHIILGLPNETREQMLSTGKEIAKLPLQGIKIHLFHLMENTPLAKANSNTLSFLTKEEYVDLVVDILEYIPPEMVIHRLTGDSPRKLLIGPKWSLNKWEVLNSIDERMKARNTWQGRLREI
ncbi:[4Fe-4S]-AdoMet protein YtqA [Candidatus Syntrophocurvum alkaliphilum]|uniref:[4Fe-4S]-AdoMet protein YtqA n=1 Tax=Candidatus Syntrophocurvum alkaliphilum TaxID=2293317 RepID=A0A6I6DI66_9FIRM|nr:TIGR01212 family radical SAM protein [Candidatus Syntrophocurvum alkaliphilum]QGT99604.1 [4Fe-4S]-AdoMet protein YtqA [Candidatus Syntrophocurvum alkaliphilum]